jgi:hypothetical protein
MVHLIGKNVEVDANGITYRGKLIEINEMEVYLETEMGWVTIMLENVSNIKKVNDQ